MKGGIFFNHKKLKIICENVLSTDKIPDESVKVNMFDKVIEDLKKPLM